MKKYLHLAAGVMATVAVGAAQAQATGANGDVCAAPTAATSGTAMGVSTYFVKAAFTPKCSANVYMSFQQTATAFGVGSGSAKGKTAFKGNTAGGGVTSDTAVTCSTSAGCSATNAQDAASNAINDAGSS